MKPKDWHVPGMHTNTELYPIPWLLCFCSIRYLYLHVPWALQDLTHPKLSPFHPLICNALNFPLPLNFAAQKVILSPVFSLSTSVPTNHRNVCYLRPRILFTALLRGCQAKHFAPTSQGVLCNDTSETDDFLGLFLLWQSALTNPEQCSSLGAGLVQATSL